MRAGVVNPKQPGRAEALMKGGHKLVSRPGGVPGESVLGKLLAKVTGEFGIGLALLIEILIFSQLSPYFLTADNILNVSLQTSITAIIAVGMTFVILTAGIDLSVGALVAFSGVVATSVLKAPFPPALSFSAAILCGLLVGMLSGFVAGVFITKFRITPFIVTLALMTIVRGAAFMYTDGRPIWGLPEEFGILGSKRILNLPVPSLIMIGVYVIAYLVLHQTRFGRHVYAVGGNP